LKISQFLSPEERVQFSIDRIREGNFLSPIVFHDSRESMMHDSLPLELFSPKTLSYILYPDNIQCHEARQPDAAPEIFAVASHPWSRLADHWRSLMKYLLVVESRNRVAQLLRQQLTMAPHSHPIQDVSNIIQMTSPLILIGRLCAKLSEPFPARKFLTARRIQVNIERCVTKNPLTMIGRHSNRAGQSAKFDVCATNFHVYYRPE
jgi:hypothetical protein